MSADSWRDRYRTFVSLGSVGVDGCGEVEVRVRIPADLSCSGRAKWKRVGIDGCIAPLVRALQRGGVDMRGSCCGHGRGPGHIDLQDGRGLLVLSPDQNERYLAASGSASARVSVALKEVAS